MYLWWCRPWSHMLLISVPVSNYLQSLTNYLKSLIVVYSTDLLVQISCGAVTQHSVQLTRYRQSDRKQGNSQISEVLKQRVIQLEKLVTIWKSYLLLIMFKSALKFIFLRFSVTHKIVKQFLFRTTCRRMSPLYTGSNVSI